MTSGTRSGLASDAPQPHAILPASFLPFEPLYNVVVWEVEAHFLGDIEASFEAKNAANSDVPLGRLCDPAGTFLWHLLQITQ